MDPCVRVHVRVKIILMWMSELLLEVLQFSIKFIAAVIDQP